MKLRQLRESDAGEISAALDSWWAGRRMSGLAPRLFFTHFQDTSYVVEENGAVVAFLIGFVSQALPEEAYVHLVGVDPAHRREGSARRLYETFFTEVAARGCRRVRCITSPVNETSVAFHRSLGFDVEAGDGEEGGVPVTKNYDGPGKDRVLFVKSLS